MRRLNWLGLGSGLGSGLGLGLGLGNPNPNPNPNPNLNPNLGGEDEGEACALAVLAAAHLPRVKRTDRDSMGYHARRRLRATPSPWDMGYHDRISRQGGLRTGAVIDIFSPPPDGSACCGRFCPKRYDAT